MKGAALGVEGGDFGFGHTELETSMRYASRNVE